MAIQLRRQGYEVEQIYTLVGRKQLEIAMRNLQGVAVDISRIVSPFSVAIASDQTVFK